MTEFGDMTLDQYRNALSSNAPTPGGGSAAAVALSQGAALAIMVCNLTEGKDKWNQGWNAASTCRDIAQPLLERGHELASEDACSFDGVMKAYSMPKETEIEIELRRNAIREGTLNAALVPMETASLALELLESLPELAKLGNANAVTDVGVAGLLASAACKGALFNVEINLSSMRNPDVVMIGRVDEMKSKCRDVSREIMHAVNDRMLN